jgi:hypothetical protein
VEEPPVLISEVTKPDTAFEPKEDLEVFAALTPIQLYFDNDMPNPRSTATTTRSSYLDTWKNYREAIKNYENYHSDTAQLNRFVSENMSKNRATAFGNCRHTFEFVETRLHGFDSAQRLHLSACGNGLQRKFG